MHPRDQTIFALSSGRPPSAIAIVRVSGPQAGPVLGGLAGKMPRRGWRPAAAARREGQPIDDAVVLWFPGPGSATGEDVAEFHVHGGRAVLAALFAALSAFENMRAAEPGEFTRRAFENGKLDLTEAEGARRSDPCRHRPAAPPGVAAAQGPARRPGARLARAASSRRRRWSRPASIFPMKAMCRRSCSRRRCERISALLDEIEEVLRRRAGANVCATAWWSRSRGRPMSASRP